MENRITTKQFESLSKEGTIAFWKWMVKKKYWTSELFMLNEKDMAIKATYRKQPKLLPTRHQLYEFLREKDPGFWMCGGVGTEEYFASQEYQDSMTATYWDCVKAYINPCEKCDAVGEENRYCDSCYWPKITKRDRQRFAKMFGIDKIETPVKKVKKDPMNLIPSSDHRLLFCPEHYREHKAREFRLRKFTSGSMEDKLSKKGYKRLVAWMRKYDSSRINKIEIRFPTVETRYSLHILTVDDMLNFLAENDTTPILIAKLASGRYQVDTRFLDDYYGKYKREFIDDLFEKVKAILEV